jgi:hypothetical protein
MDVIRAQQRELAMSFSDHILHGAVLDGCLFSGA